MNSHTGSTRPLARVALQGCAGDNSRASGQHIQHSCTDMSNKVLEGTSTRRGRSDPPGSSRGGRDRESWLQNTTRRNTHQDARNTFIRQTAAPSAVYQPRDWHMSLSIPASTGICNDPRRFFGMRLPFYAQTTPVTSSFEADQGAFSHTFPLMSMNA